MRACLRSRLTFANVTSLLALFVALSGGAYAATQIADNSVGTKKLKDGAVKNAKLAKNAVTREKVAKNTLRSGQIDESSLTVVPQAKHALDANRADLANA